MLSSTGFARRMLLAAVAALSLSTLSNAALANDWRTRSVYQVITDRFGRTDNSTTSPCDPSKQLYCGGTWQGIINNLDYIQGMGFTAIWISPVVENFNGTSKYGEAYHGFWTQNIYNLNDNFGGANDLKDLADALHKRDMYLMVDVVTNNYAWPGAHTAIDYSTFTPFNSVSYFHPFCWITNYEDLHDASHCWLGDDNVALPDVNTDDSHVQSVYNDWVSDLVKDYSIDGLRIDAAKHVGKSFWESFTNAAGVFTIGEVFDSNITMDCYFMEDALSSVLNFPIYQPMINAFKSQNSVMWPVYNAYTNVTNNCTDSTVLGTFTENQDVGRFASFTEDLTLAKNVITFTMLSDGIPMIYNGQEQHFNGANDPLNREAIWLSGYNTSAPLYQHVKMMNKVRNLYVKLVEGNTQYSEYWKYKAKLNYADNKRLAVRKGIDNYQIISILNNYGGAQYTAPELMIGDNSFVEGEPIIDVLTCNSIRVQQYGFFNVTIKNGEPQVYMAAANLVGTDICQDTVKRLNPKCVGAHCTANSDATRPSAIGGSFLALFLAVLVLSSL